MQSLTHFLRSSNLNFNSSFGSREQLASVSLVSSQRRTRKLKTRTLSAVEDFTLAVAFRNTKMCWDGETIDNKARGLFWKSTVKTKHQSLTSLVFMWLIPGAEWVVCHICNRCIISIVIGPSLRVISNLHSSSLKLWAQYKLLLPELYDTRSNY